MDWGVCAIVAWVAIGGLVGAVCAAHRVPMDREPNLLAGLLIGALLGPIGWVIVLLVGAEIAGPPAAGERRRQAAATPEARPQPPVVIELEGEPSAAEREAFERWRAEQITQREDEIRAANRGLKAEREL